MSDELTPYAVAWGWQKAILDARLAALSAERDDANEPGFAELPEDAPAAALPLGARDCLLLVQHPAVVTLGTGSTPDNLKFDPADPEAPFEVHRTERGGEATYHGPGQIVLYPILDLARRRPDLHWYMRALEEVAIVAMGDLGVRYAGRVEGLTGAWANVRDEETARRADERKKERTTRAADDVTPLGAREHKVAAIGVRARRWVTYHGMAFNVDPDLGDFRHIVPCGIGDRPVGSVKQLLAGEAGVVSSAAGSVSGADENGRGACGGGRVRRGRRRRPGRRPDAPREDGAASRVRGGVRNRADAKRRRAAGVAGEETWKRQLKQSFFRAYASSSSTRARVQSMIARTCLIPRYAI